MFSWIRMFQNIPSVFFTNHNLYKYIQSHSPLSVGFLSLLSSLSVPLLLSLSSLSLSIYLSLPARFLPLLALLSLPWLSLLFPFFPSVFRDFFEGLLRLRGCRTCGRVKSFETGTVIKVCRNNNDLM